MTTLATLQSEIADEINRTDLNTQITLYLNRAIQFYANNFKFWFNEEIASFNTVIGQFAYTSADGVPTLIKSMDYLKIAINSTNNVPLTKRTYDYVQTANAGTLTGTPTDYAYYKESFFLYPVPNQVFAMTLSYTKAYADLSAGGDNNDFTNNAQNLIEHRAVFNLYDRIIKDYEAADRAKTRETEALVALLKETVRLTTSHKKRPSTF